MNADDQLRRVTLAQAKRLKAALFDWEVCRHELGKAGKG